MSHTDAIISLSHIGFSPSGQSVLEDINLELHQGHFMGIVGPNGAGKSTLLGIIAGLISPDHGHIDLFGQCLNRFNRHQLFKQVGFLNQLHEHQPRLPLRVRDVVRMGLPNYHLPFRKLASSDMDVQQALEQVNMGDKAEADFRQLSGGQRQRVRLARALVRKPGLLLLDEPSAALDSSSQEQLYQLLRQLADQGTTIIMVEHDIAAITGHVDSVACLSRRIHYHAMRGEQIPEDVWHSMYGDHMHVIAHDASCIGCQHDKPQGTAA